MPKKKPTKKPPAKRAKRRKAPRKKPPPSPSVASARNGLAQQVPSVAKSSPAASQKRRTALGLWLRGEQVSSHQIKLVCDYLRPLFARVPQKLVVELLGTSKQALGKWLGQGAPRNDDSTYNLAELLGWLYKRWIEKGRKGGGEADVREAEAAVDLQIKEENLRRLTAINDLRESRVTPSDQVELLLLEQQNVYLASVQGLPKLAGSLADKPSPVIRRILGGVHKELRGALASKMKTAKAEQTKKGRVKRAR